jgi:hypothetical protein
VKVAVFALLVALVVGCGASQREATLRTSFVTVNAAKDGFAAWDQAHQAALVDEATSLSDGQAKLAAYRASRERVDAAFEVAYRAVAFAAVTDGGTAESGDRRRRGAPRSYCSASGTPGAHAQSCGGTSHSTGTLTGSGSGSGASSGCSQPRIATVPNRRSR